MAELTESGCVGFSQADVPVTDTQVLQRALQYAATFGYTVWLRPQDAWLGKGVAASGAVATRLGLSGVPVAGRDDRAAHHLRAGARHRRARAPVPLSSAAGVALLRRPRPKACR
jgi:dihydroorotase